MPNHNIFTFSSLPWDKLIEEADGLLSELFPICRSITGDGVRQTLTILQDIADFDILEIPSGTTCYDWTVPDEWNIRDAYIADSTGRKIIDFKENNLHVVNYSMPIDQHMSFQELDQFLHTLPNLPEAIPYRTTYYNRTWGFCLSYQRWKQMDRNEQYHAYIDATLARGSLTLGEALIKGDSGQEFLISTYCCHPSLANDSLSGVVLWVLLLRELQRSHPRHSYRFIIVPETIGAIAYLSKNQEQMKTIAGGLISTTVAGPGKFGYKHTFLNNHLIDRVVQKTFKELGKEYIAYPFHVNGSDESHYSAPYFRIPVGTICKDKYYEYDYYHTSLDDLNFISAENLVETLKIYLLTIEKLEMNLTYRSLNPYCEAMLSKRGLYPTIGGAIQQRAVSFDEGHHDRQYKILQEDTISGDDLDAIGWSMFYSDGQTSLLDISEKTEIPLKQLYRIAEILLKHELLERVEAPNN